MTPATRTKWTKNVLVVANVTAVSDELLTALLDISGEQSTAFTLIVPATPSEADRERLEAAVERLLAAGLQVEGRIADSDPLVAVSEAWDPRRYDAIVISTLPIGSSRWLSAGLPRRIADLTGALVTHVVSEPPRPVVTAPPRPHEKHPLGPLSVLGWGGHSGHSS